MKNKMTLHLDDVVYSISNATNIATKTSYEYGGAEAARPEKH